MIDISFEVDREGICSGFLVRGHAGYAPRGSDIVCAAVSALTQGAAHTLQEMKEPGAKVVQSDAELICIIDRPDIATQAIFAMVKRSLQELESQYSGYIKVCHGSHGTFLLSKT